MAERRGAEDSMLSARLTAQLLAGRPAASAVAGIRHLLAVQAQDPRGARLALRLRSRAQHASEVDEALTRDRSLVITWVNRGTLHLIAAEDEPLLHLLTTPQLRTSNDRRLQQEGVSPAAAQRGVDILVTALASHGPMTRGQIRDRLESADIPVARQALVHILLRATLDGWILRGPMVGSEHAFVLVEDWLGKRPKLDRDRALAELASRYLTGHGPAGERDLAKWAQLPRRDTRIAFGAIAGRLRERSDGLFDLRDRPTSAALPPPRLLGPFDPLLLGWASREFIVADSAHVITTNGIFKAIALIHGRAAGTWTLPDGRVKLNVWNDPGDAVTAALASEAAAVERYLARSPGS